MKNGPLTCVSQEVEQEATEEKQDNEEEAPKPAKKSKRAKDRLRILKEKPAKVPKDTTQV